MFLANFLIALREGIEAALIVGIIVGYLVKLKRTEILPQLWAGIAAAVVIPLGIGAYLTWGPYELDFKAQELIGGGLSLIAAGFITWMILWMAENAHTLSTELRDQTDQALAKGAGWGIFWLAVLSVGREGIETAVFVWATVNSSATTGVWEPALGVVTGLITAAVVGYLFYKGAVSLNLRLFFQVTGYLLLFVAAGVVAYGLGDLQEAGILPGWGITAYNIIPIDHVGSIWFVLLNAMFNVQAILGPTYLQLIGWIGYLAIAGSLFAMANRRKPKKSPAKAASEVTADATTNG